MDSTPATNESRPDDLLAEVLAWLDHEASLLEILAYRLNGLTNILRSRSHSMVCSAAADVETVHDQLLLAAVHRDMALLSLAQAGSGVLPTAELLQRDVPSDEQRAPIRDVCDRIRNAAEDVDRARSECALGAGAYRPREFQPPDDARPFS